MKIVKLWDIAVEFEKLGNSVKDYIELIRYALKKGKDIVVLNDVSLEGEEDNETSNVIFFTSSFQAAEKVKKRIKKCGLTVRARIFLSITNGPNSIIVLTSEGGFKELRETLSSSEKPDCVALAKALS